MAFAHSRNSAGQRHDLVAHLETVAELARGFADRFSGGELAYWAGLWHDLGKFQDDFQAYLLACDADIDHPRVSHSIWGAVLSYALLTQDSRAHEAWKEIVLPIAGHHTGLAAGGAIAQRCTRFLSDHPDALTRMRNWLTALPSLPLYKPQQMAPVDRELFTRMIFSALVDADYLDTERHFQSNKARARRGPPSLARLSILFDKRQQSWMAKKPATPVNLIRREIYDACVTAAANSPGIFRLTVPTGGGKTRSGLAFALHHARVHPQLRRIVVAIPYTSIIDQTAGEYRSILGDNAVLEHHSQFVPPEDERADPGTQRLRLATENWDAPIIVTTTVQLFESLLSNRPSHVRKLHNLAHSIIVLDEVQTLPLEILTPTTDVLRSLVERYGVTLVLSTATQPALEESRYLKSFHNLPVREIVQDYARHFEALRRVTYEQRPKSFSPELLAEEVRVHDQIMVVLNTRRDALRVLAMLRTTPETYHLSTLLCPAHRRHVLAIIKTRLKANQPVRLISTQVVEAGVDLDFPTVWRVVGPLDRIVQAAGRCNRDGKLGAGNGRVVIFELDGSGAPLGPYHVAIEEARSMLAQYDADRLNDPALYREFFARLFAAVDLDKHHIQNSRAVLDYPRVAEHYRLIRDDTLPIVVPYEESFKRLADWRAQPSRRTWQRLQPYLVNVSRREIERLLSAGQPIEQVDESLYYWRDASSYDERVGLQQVIRDVSDLVFAQKEE